MSEKIKTIIAFTVLGVLMIAGAVLVKLDRTTDVYPEDSTKIRLYGEAHGIKEYYDAELESWKERYDEGYRSLFVELPYYSAEFLNLWMKEDNDELIDQLFVEIQGTLSGNEHYYEFFHEIREYCPDTVFYGTDVGHQYDTTGARYLEYLEANGLADSENYALAEACIRQGKEYRAGGSTNGVSPIREGYMVSNFIDAYERCGSEKIMGIYGSYHTHLDIPDLMAGRLRSHYGNVISSVRLRDLLFEKKIKPYTFGFCISGLVFLLMLFVPNIIWAKKKKPVGYEGSAKDENKLLLLFERIGQMGVTAVLLIFRDFDPSIAITPDGVLIKNKIFFWGLAFALMILYECYWIKYFRSPGTMKDFYASFAGFPVAGASLPVIAALILGIYSGNLIMICLTVILGIGHIGIHMKHRQEAYSEL